MENLKKIVDKFLSNELKKFLRWNCAKNSRVVTFLKKSPPIGLINSKISLKLDNFLSFSLNAPTNFKGDKLSSLGNFLSSKFQKSHETTYFFIIYCSFY
jgi:uncharacterized UBP type Zn finger protein